MTQYDYIPIPYYIWYSRHWAPVAGPATTGSKLYIDILPCIERPAPESTAQIRHYGYRYITHVKIAPQKATRGAPH